MNRFLQRMGICDSPYYYVCIATDFTTLCYPKRVIFLSLLGLLFVDMPSIVAIVAWAKVNTTLSYNACRCRSPTRGKHTIE